jgi:hypothetical protein
MSILLELAGIEYLTIQSHHKPEQRAAHVEKFNDVRSGVDVLLTSQAIGAVGLDLQHACCRGLMLNYHWSANHAMQMIGRLVRIGQKREVIWECLTIPGTIYELVEKMMWKKMFQQTAATGWFPPHVKGTLGLAFAAEYIRCCWHQHHNRFFLEVTDQPDALRNAQWRAAATELSAIVRACVRDEELAQHLASVTVVDLYGLCSELARRRKKDPAMKVNASTVIGIGFPPPTQADLPESAEEAKLNKRNQAATPRKSKGTSTPKKAKRGARTPSKTGRGTQLSAELVVDSESDGNESG